MRFVVVMDDYRSHSWEDLLEAIEWAKTLMWLNPTKSVMIEPIPF